MQSDPTGQKFVRSHFTPWTCVRRSMCISNGYAIRSRRENRCRDVISLRAEGNTIGAIDARTSGSRRRRHGAICQLRSAIG